MRAVDTNVVLRILVRDDKRQTAAADHFISEGAWVSLVVLLETAWALESVYDRSDADIAEAVEMLLNHATLTLQLSDVVAAALELFRLKPALGFADCLILAMARSSGHLPLGTFDRKLARLDGAHLLSAGSRSV